MSCYICEKLFKIQVMKKIFGNEPELENVRNASIKLRENSGKAPKDITPEDRICLNCSKNVNQLLENDPFLLEMNVLASGKTKCIICENKATRVLPFSARINVYVERNIYIPDNMRICDEHLTSDKTKIQKPILLVLNATIKKVLLDGKEVKKWFESLRNEAKKAPLNKYANESSFTNEEFRSLTGISKGNFITLFDFCNYLPEFGEIYRKIEKKDLITFLTKLKQGLSDPFLKVIFDYSSDSLVSLIIQNVRSRLMKTFVPKFLGPDSIDREKFIHEHVSDFHNTLYNSNADGSTNPKVPILIIDGTYIYIEKSSNFRVLKQSFCMHKGRHLFKPVIVVAPDGYILDVHGPYFADGKNNDASLLKDQVENETSPFKNWIKPGDKLLVDRGYRDYVDTLESIGIVCKMPLYLPKGSKQHSTEESNSSRLVTKSRWIVESRNGHIKNFKFLDNVVSVKHWKNIGDFVRIVCAIINAFYPTIAMSGANSEMALKMLDKAQEPNVVQAKVEEENLDRKRKDWLSISENHLPDFPNISIEYLKDITFGIYQVKLAKSYTHDKIKKDSEYSIDILEVEPGFLRARIYSRFRNAEKYNLWIAFNTNSDDMDKDYEPILGWFCKCKTGARTLGCCAHIASVIWYLGYARHQPKINYPSDDIFRYIQDGAHREIPSIL